MDEIATQNDILELYKQAGGGNAAVLHPTECVTKSEVLSAPSEQTLGFKVGVSATDYKDNELCAVTDVSITKANKTVYISWDDEAFDSACSGFYVQVGYTYDYISCSSDGTYDSWSFDVPNDVTYLVASMAKVRVENTGQYDNTFYFSYQIGATETIMEECLIPHGGAYRFGDESAFNWNLSNGTHIFFRIREKDG